MARMYLTLLLIPVAILFVGCKGTSGSADAGPGGVGSSASVGNPAAGASGSGRHDGTGRGQADVSRLRVPEGMAAVPGGPFFRGCGDGANGVVDDKCAPSEKPAGQVSVSTFFIDVNEVTVGRYMRCVSKGACPEPPAIGECNFGESDRLQYAINCVTWEDADRFCRFEGKRLPTEAEWEKAARGTDGRRYPWGDDEPDKDGVFRANWGDGLAKILWMRDQWEYDGPVGYFAKWPSPYGCNDMAGNVGEWVSDWWADSHAGSRTLNPKGSEEGEQRVTKGGSFREFHQRIRTSARDYHPPEFWDGHIGFRCAADVGSSAGAGL